MIFSRIQTVAVYALVGLAASAPTPDLFPNGVKSGTVNFGDYSVSGTVGPNGVSGGAAGVGKGTADAAAGSVGGGRSPSGGAATAGRGGFTGSAAGSPGSRQRPSDYYVRLFLLTRRCPSDQSNV
ncbi:hypothetical protein BDV98DRAFT_432874 [Pterulicium gracile]|uniref:Uncharacterized protein n=1 Tax=Pterulicium gracile TaxID=1884261 RepID=A0A5C3QPW6_9AGAR|nr:hypothetical protein BDV98DRAFT_432874 [Pterula gracilis]